MRFLSTSTQVWLFLVVVSLGCLVMGYEVGGRLGLFLGLLTAVGLHIFIFVFGDTRLLKKIRAVPLKGRDPWQLNERTERYSRQIGLTPPDLSLVNTSSGLAFTLSQPWRRGRLVLSTGLLEKLTPLQMEAVIAHQLGQLHHMDSFRFGVLAWTGRLILGFASFLDNLWIPNFFLKRRQEPFLHALAPFAGLILNVAINSKSFFQNDDWAARLVSDKRALAEALWKMDGLSRTQPFSLPPCTSHYFVVNPQGILGGSRWLDSHPPVPVRIRRLIGTDTI